MPDGTVHGRFDLTVDQAVRDLHSVRDAGAEADASLHGLGTTMDNLGGPQARERLRSYRESIAGVGTTAEQTATKVATSWEAQARSVDNASRQMENRITALEYKMDRFSSKRATARIDLDGVAEANVQLSELEARLDRLNGRTVRANVAGGGGGGAQSVTRDLTGGGGGFPSQTPFGALGGFGGMAAMALGLSPAIMGLAGGATALAGSAGSAALGAGAVGLAGYAEAGVGGLGTYLVGKQDVTAITNVTKAQQAYTMAVQEFGRASTEAATAKAKLNAEMVAGGAGAVAAARQLELLSSDWRAASAPARAAFNQGVTGSVYNLRRGVPAFANDATVSTRAVAGAATSFTGFLTSPAMLSSTSQLTHAFAADLPVAERTLENITSTVMNLAVAATPFFHEANVWVEHWTKGWADSSSNTLKVREDMRHMVDSAKDWAHLGGAGFDLLKDLLRSGAPTGDSMVVSLTRTLDHWDQWVRDNPQKLQTFFSQSEHTVGQIATGVGHIASDFAQVGQLLGPIFDRLLSIANIVLGLGPGGISMIAALGFGGIKGLTGASSGSILRSAATGSGGPIVASAMGGRAAGGVMAEGRAVSARTSYLVPEQSFQNFTAAATGQPSWMLPGLAAAGYAVGRNVGIATPEAFAARYGTAGAATAEAGTLGAGVVGARFAAATSQLGQAETALTRMSGALGTFASSAVRFAAPVVAITAALQGAAAPGDIGDKLMSGIGAGLNMATFGLLPKNALARAVGIDAAPTGASLSNPATQAGLTAIGNQVKTVQSPQDLVAARAAIQSVRIQYELPSDQAKRLKDWLSSAMDAAATNAGRGSAAALGNALTTALGRDLNSPSGIRKDINTALSGITTTLRELGPRGAKEFASSTAQWAKQMMEDNPKLRAPLERLMQGIVDDMNKLDKTTGSTLADLRDKTFYFNGQIYTGMTSTWGAIWTDLTNKGTVANEHLLGIFGSIQSEAVNALSGMGFSKAQAQRIVTQASHGGQDAANAAASITGLQATGTAAAPLSTSAPPGLKKARGGVIAGNGLQDNVLMPDGGLAAPGEAWIANRHTMDDISRATIEKYGVTAWQMIQGERRPHDAPRRAYGGGTVPQVAQRQARSNANAANPYVDPIPGFSLGRTDMGVDANAAPGTPILAIGDSRLVNVLQGWYAGQPLLDFELLDGPDRGRFWYVAEQISPVTETVGSTFKAGQMVGRYAPTGTGIEIGWAAGPSGQTLAQATTGYSEGQATSAGQGFLNFLTGLAHGQLVPGGPGGGAGVPQINLKAPKSGLGGFMGPMVDTPAQAYAAALQAKVNKAIGATAGGGGYGGPMSGNIMAIAQAAAAAAGVPWDAAVVSMLLQKESGGGQNLPPQSYGGGLDPAGPFQVIGSTFASYEAPGHTNRMNPVDNTIAAMRYIKSRYGTLENLASQTGLFSASYHGYSRGGQVKWGGWNESGVDTTVDGPTLFGAGEGGRERVKIGPAAGPFHNATRGRGHVINVHIGSVGSAKDAEELADVVAEKILEALDNVEQGHTEAGLMGVPGR